jgi:hypothetical protein
MKQLIPLEKIETRIFLIRGQKVMISPHLAELYGVENRVLIQAVKRNVDRFPDDFMFRLNSNEANWLVSQNVIPHIKYFGGSLPYAFTEQGVAMLSGILNSKRAVQINILIMRAFVNLRQALAVNKEVMVKLEELEHKIAGHDVKIQAIIEAIKRLTIPAEPAIRKEKIGFQTDKN